MSTSLVSSLHGPPVPLLRNRASARRCKCRKSKCLKLYCDCFSAGVFCAFGCSCVGCMNSEHFRDEVEAAQNGAKRSSLVVSVCDGEGGQEGCVRARRRHGRAGSPGPCDPTQPLPPHMPLTQEAILGTLYPISEGLGLEHRQSAKHAA